MALICKCGKGSPPLWRNRWFESGSLQQRVCELSVPERRLPPRRSLSRMASSRRLGL